MEQESTPPEILEGLLAKIVNQPCWSMIGPTAGSMFTLDFGQRRKRDVALRNDKLREEQRQFTGQYSLSVKHSGWRIFQAKKCICHCNDSNETGGPMATGLRQLENRILKRFSFEKSPAELMLAFDEQLQLYLCDWEGVSPEDVAYVFFGEGRAVAVKMSGVVSVQVSTWH